MAHSRAPLHPSAVLWAALPLELSLPLYRCVAVKAAADPALFRREVPRATFALPRRRRGPWPRLLGRPALSPRASWRKKRALSFTVGPLTTDCRGVVTPSSYDWPTLRAQLCWGGHWLVGDDCSPAPTMPLHRLLAGCQDGLESKLGLACWVWSAGKPKNVASRFARILAARLRDACCTGLQGQPPTGALRRDDVLTLV